jgi:hypothetical protein
MVVATASLQNLRPMPARWGGLPTQAIRLPVEFISEVVEMVQRKVELYLDTGGGEDETEEEYVERIMGAFEEALAQQQSTPAPEGEPEDAQFNSTPDAAPTPELDELTQAKQAVAATGNDFYENQKWANTPNQQTYLAMCKSELDMFAHDKKELADIKNRLLVLKSQGWPVDAGTGLGFRTRSKPKTKKQDKKAQRRLAQAKKVGAAIATKEQNAQYQQNCQQKWSENQLYIYRKQQLAFEVADNINALVESGYTEPALHLQELWKKLEKMSFADALEALMQVEDHIEQCSLNGVEYINFVTSEGKKGSTPLWMYKKFFGGLWNLIEPRDSKEDGVKDLSGKTLAQSVKTPEIEDRIARYQKALYEISDKYLGKLRDDFRDFGKSQGYEERSLAYFDEVMARFSALKSESEQLAFARLNLDRVRSFQEKHNGKTFMMADLHDQPCAPVSLVKYFFESLEDRAKTPTMARTDVLEALVKQRTGNG